MSNECVTDRPTDQPTNQRTQPFIHSFKEDASLAYLALLYNFRIFTALKNVGQLKALHEKPRVNDDIDYVIKSSEYCKNCKSVSRSEQNKPKTWAKVADGLVGAVLQY